MQGRTRVMVIDDHEIARAGIVSILERAPDLEVVGAVGSAEEALGLLDALTPEVVLLDYRLRGMNGAVACGEIARRRPGTAVIVLSSSTDDAVIHACLAAGASGYLLKTASGDDLPAAVRAAARGESALAPEVVDRVIEWARKAKTIHQGGQSLASHEILVLSLAAKGLKNREIARRIDVSEGSVKLYIGSAMRKLGASERAEAVAAGIRKGLI